MKVLYNENEINARVNELASQISVDYAGKEIDIICLLNGASVFCTDLIRAISVPVKLHHLGFNSYTNPTVSGEVRITLDIQEPLLGKHVLILEGLLISGRTPKYIFDLINIRKPESLEICAVGMKRKLMTADIGVKYLAFEFTDENVVGYGIGSGNDKSLPYLIDSK